MPLIPEVGNAYVEDKKARDYLLDVSHREGGAKARFFLLFGFERERWQDLRDALVEHAQTNEELDSRISPHGIKYTVRCNIRSPDGRNPCITTVWIADDDISPRLVTVVPR